MNVQRHATPAQLQADPSLGVMFDAGEEPGGELNLRALLLKVWHGRWIIAACVAVALVLALLAISQLKPTYIASAKVLFENDTTNVADLQEVVAAREFTRETLGNEIQILTSTSLVERVIDRLGLDRNPQFNPALRGDTSGFSLGALLDWRTYVSRATLADLGLVDPPEPTFQDPELAARRQRLEIVNNVRDGLSLEPVDGSRVIEIAFEGESPAMSARIVNTIAEQYIVDQLESKLTATRRASEWLADRIDQLGERVRTAELAVEQARTELAESSGQTAAMTQQQLGDLNRTLVLAQAERTALETRLRSVSSALANEEIDLGAVSMFRDAETIRRLRREESELLSREATLAALAKDNPRRVQLQLALNDIRESIRNEANRVAAALRADVEEARQSEEALEAQVRELEIVEQEQRRGEVALRQLEREAQASRVLYESFLARLEETSQQESLQTAGVRILSPAEVPTIPASATKKRILLLALVLGGGAGIGLIFLLDRLNNTFRNVPETEAQTGLPVLASLPSAGQGIETAEILQTLKAKPNGVIAEAVRNMRTSILFSGDEALRNIAFTSSVPGEGKSTTSLLMAITSQQMGRSAVIVDCDLRRHTLSQLIRGDEDRPGLLSVLDGAATVEEAVHTDPDTGLNILTVKPKDVGQDRSAADVLSSPQFANLLKTLERQYDLVILDTPPTLAVTDPRIIGRLVQTIIYIVRWDHTPRDAVLEGIREMSSIATPLGGIVMTMVNTGRASSYSYSAYGRYRHKYAGYYN